MHETDSNRIQRVEEGVKKGADMVAVTVGQGTYGMALSECQ